MSDAYIIVRAMGGRRYQFLQPTASDGAVWKKHPGESYTFNSKESADSFIEIQKDVVGFQPDDFSRVLHPHDNQHCRYCNSPAVRHVGTAVEHPAVTLDFNCNACHVSWQDIYTHRSHVRDDSLPGY